MYYRTTIEIDVKSCKVLFFKLKIQLFDVRGTITVQIKKVIIFLTSFGEGNVAILTVFSDYCNILKNDMKILNGLNISKISMQQEKTTVSFHYRNKTCVHL